MIKLDHSQRGACSKLSATLEQLSQMSHRMCVTPALSEVLRAVTRCAAPRSGRPRASSSPEFSSQQRGDCGAAERLPPGVGIGIENFNGLQVRRAVKASHSHELPVHHRQAHLQERTQRREETARRQGDLHWFLGKSLWPYVLVTCLVYLII